MENNEEKKVGIPESITINGATYYVKDTPELQQFIQEVAKVEKAKLYTQFENLKAQIANLGRVKVVGEEMNTESLVNSLVDKLKDTFITKEDLKESLPNVLKEVVNPLLQDSEKNKQEELAQYREKIISENIDTCIPDLVKGETKEELLSSLNESIRIRSSYPTPSTAGQENRRVVDPLIVRQYGEQAPTQSPTPRAEGTSPAVNVPTPPPAPRRPSPDASGPANVRRMTMDEFAKQRENLREQLETMYGGSSL